MNSEPRLIAAKYPARCPQTGKQINKGESCVWFPSARKIYHPESRAGIQAIRMINGYEGVY